MKYEIIGKYSDTVQNKNGKDFAAIHIIYIDIEDYLLYVFNTYINRGKLADIEKDANFKLDINYENLIELKPLQSEILDLQGLENLLKNGSIKEKMFNDLKSKLRQLKIAFVINEQGY